MSEQEQKVRDLEIENKILNLQVEVQQATIRLLQSTVETMMQVVAHQSLPACCELKGNGRLAVNLPEEERHGLGIVVC